MSSETSGVPILSRENRNFEIWQARLEGQCDSKNPGVWSTIFEESSPDPANAVATAAYKTANRVISGYILNYLEEADLAEVRPHKGDGKKMMQVLEAIHIQKKSINRFNALSKVLDTRQEPNEKPDAFCSRILTYLTLFRRLKPPGYTVSDLEEELAAWAMLHNLSEEHSVMQLDAIETKNAMHAMVQEAHRKEHEPSQTALKASGAFVASSTGPKHAYTAPSLTSTATPSTPAARYNA